MEPFNNLLKKELEPPRSFIGKFAGFIDYIEEKEGILLFRKPNDYTLEFEISDKLISYRVGLN